MGPQPNSESSTSRWCILSNNIIHTERSANQDVHLNCVKKMIRQYHASGLIYKNILNQNYQVSSITLQLNIRARHCASAKSTYQPITSLVEIVLRVVKKNLNHGNIIESQSLTLIILTLCSATPSYGKNLIQRRKWF